MPAIGMTKVDGPFVSEAHGQGIVIVAESHIFLQVQGSEAICIVFSCRPFSWANVLHVLRAVFGGRWAPRYEVERSVPPKRGWFSRLVRAFASWWVGPGS